MLFKGALNQAGQLREDCGVARAAGVAGGREDEVEAEGQLVLEVSEGFAEAALDEVAGDGVAGAASNGDPHAGEGEAVSTEPDPEHAVVSPGALLEGVVEVGGAADSFLPAQTLL